MLGKINFNLEKNVNETQLDFSYLTSPSLLEKKIEHLDKNQYLPMDHSKIFLKFLILSILIINTQSKKILMKKKSKKIKI